MPQLKTSKQRAAIEQTQAFWANFYGQSTASGSLRHTPSPFAQWCLEHRFNAQTRILELGCGNGRDSFAFLHHGLPVVAVDGSPVAIDNNQRHYQQHRQNAQNAQKHYAAGSFHALDFADLGQLSTLANGDLQKVNTLYTRFVLHAIPEALEDQLLDHATALLPAGAQMWHEFRTLRDPMMQEGRPLSTNERLTDHYRRYLDPKRFRAKLQALGWQEIFFIESDGLARFGTQNPVVARIGAVK